MSSIMHTLARKSEKKMMLSETLIAGYAQSFGSDDNDNIIHQLSDGDASFSHELFAFLLREYSDKAVNLMQSHCFELFPIALKSCNCMYFDDETDAWLHAERVLALVQEALTQLKLSNALSAKELHLVCIDHLALHCIVPAESEEELHSTVCLRFWLLCECTFSALYRLKTTEVGVEDTELESIAAACSSYARKYSHTLRALVALLTELVSLIAEAERKQTGCVTASTHHIRVSCATDGAGETANEATILSLLVTAAETLHKYTFGPLPIYSFAQCGTLGYGLSNSMCGRLDVTSIYARIFTCIDAFSNSNDSIFDGVLLNPTHLLLEEHRLQQSVAGAGYLLSLVLLLVSNIFLFPTDDAPHGLAGVYADIFRALVVYTLRYQDCCGTFLTSTSSSANANANATEVTRVGELVGVSAWDLLIHPFRCRDFVMRHYSAARAVWCRERAETCGFDPCGAVGMTGDSYGASTTEQPWYKTLPANECAANDTYFCKVCAQSDRASVFAAKSVIPWSYICSDSVINQVRDYVSDCNHSAAIPPAARTHDMLCVYKFNRCESGDSGTVYSHAPQYVGEIVHGLNWNIVAISTLMLGMVDPRFLELRTPAEASGQQPLPLPLPLGVYSKELMYEVSLPSFISLLSKSTAAASDCLRSNCMALALRLGRARYDLLTEQVTSGAARTSSVDRTQLSMTQLLVNYHHKGSGRGKDRGSVEFIFVPHSVTAPSLSGVPAVADVPLQLPLLDHSGDRIKKLQALSLCRLQASSCDAFSIAVCLCNLMNTLSMSAINMTLVGEDKPLASSSDFQVGQVGAPQVHMLLKKFLCTMEPGSLLLLLRVMIYSEHMSGDALGCAGNRSFAVSLLIDIVKGLCQYQLSQLQSLPRRAPILCYPTSLPPTTHITGVKSESGLSLSEESQLLASGIGICDNSQDRLNAASIAGVLKWFVIDLLCEKQKAFEALVTGSQAVAQKLQDDHQADFISALNLTASLAVFLISNPAIAPLNSDPQRLIQSRFMQIRQKLQAFQALINVKSSGTVAASLNPLHASIMLYNITSVIERCSMVTDYCGDRI